MRTTSNQRDTETVNEPPIEKQKPGSNGHGVSRSNGSTNGYASTNLNRYTTDSTLYQWHTRVFHEEILSLVEEASPRRLLDAGCGEGYVTNLIARHFPRTKITGIDYSEGAITYARHNFRRAADFKVASIFELPYPDDHFDLVLCSEVLEHLEDPLSALKELIRVSRRHVLITVPREPYFKWLNDIGQGLNLCPDPGHVQFWTKQSFQEYFGPHFADTEFAWKHTYQLMLAKVK